MMAPRYDTRAASATDHDDVFALVLATSREYVTQTWGWSDAVQQAVLEDFERWFNPPATGQIIQAQGRAVGYLKVVEHEAELRLEMIMLAPEMHGHGLGGAILDDVLAAASARRLPVVLQVMKVNPAIRLYERRGFEIVEDLPHHIVMRKQP